MNAGSMDVWVRPGMPRNEISSTGAIVFTLRALVDVLLTMPDLPSPLIERLRQLKASLHDYAQPADVYDMARAISDLCETAQRNLGR